MLGILQHSARSKISSISFWNIQGVDSVAPSCCASITMPHSGVLVEFNAVRNNPVVPVLTPNFGTLVNPTWYQCLVDKHHAKLKALPCH